MGGREVMIHGRSRGHDTYEGEVMIKVINPAKLI